MSAMWDRLRTAGGPHKLGSGPHVDDRQGSSNSQSWQPRKHNTVNNNSELQAGTPFGYNYTIRGGPAPARPPREFTGEQYNAAPTPPVHAPPARNPNRNTYRNSNFRPTSSLYSQPSPQGANFSGTHVNAQRYPGGPEDISPPSSPEVLTPRNGPHQQPSPDISPIDEEDSQSARAMSQLNLSSSRPTGQQAPPPEQSARSNIPMMRRARRKQSDAALREKNSREALHRPHPETSKADVRWDAMTGELTTSDRGRPSQVKPADYARGLGISVDPSTSPPSQGSPTSFGDRVKQMARSGGAGRAPKGPQLPSTTDPAIGAFSSNRPGWRGASGRTTLVAPVHDTPDVAPLKIPRKSSKRTASPVSKSQPSADAGLDTILASPPVSPPGAPETGSARKGISSTIRKIVPSSQQTQQAQQAQAYPSPPLSGSSNPAPNTALNSLPSQLQSSPAPAPVPAQAPIKRKPPPSHAGHKVDNSLSSVYSQADAASQPPNQGDNLQLPGAGQSPWVQPGSRFSVTTYATSAHTTPRESLDEFAEPPPMPTPPQHYLNSSPSPATYHDSVMDRRKPKLRSGGDEAGESEPIRISLGQPWMSTAFATSAGPGKGPKGPRDLDTAKGPVGRARTNPDPGARPQSGASTMSSINKSLPAPPPETEAESARDRVAFLNAQLQGLGNRRINITKSIKQMTELMPQDNLMASADVIHKRELEKRKVEALRLELAEVQREEYEIGLKLHRAYKRMDRDADYEPTTLWVRRVTG